VTRCRAAGFFGFALVAREQRMVGESLVPDIQIRSAVMLNLVITLLIIALIAGVLGFGGIAGAAVSIAKIVFFVALVLFLISLLAGGLRGGFSRRL